MAASEKDFAFLRDVMEKNSSNRLEGPNKEFFQRRLARLADHSGANGVGTFVEMLRASPSDCLDTVVAEAMTIKETSFFRDVAPFDLLRDKLIPQLIQKRQHEKRLLFWSAASSTGQEAYSLAMLIQDYFPQLIDWDIRITGTDISKQACDYAREGRYRRLEVNRGLPVKLLLRHFDREGEQWRVKPELRSLVEFRRLNLCAPVGLLPKFDVVLLRNVLLYFNVEDRKQVLREVHNRMSHDAVLLLGAAEQAEDSSELFRVELDSSCYFYRPVPPAGGLRLVPERS
jgi:chemotaxis protein methyltransferase CheR